jgi:hypothetical protein
MYYCKNMSIYIHTHIPNLIRDEKEKVRRQGREENTKLLKEMVQRKTGRIGCIHMYVI